MLFNAKAAGETAQNRITISMHHWHLLTAIDSNYYRQNVRLLSIYCVAPSIDNQCLKTWWQSYNNAEAEE